jgi:hypothetical protein
MLHNLLIHQITHLNINVVNEPTTEVYEILSRTFVLILSLCQRLISLNFDQLLSDRMVPVYMWELPSISCMSSTLTKLKVNVETFSACLYLLDGRLNCLTTLIVNVTTISSQLPDINDTVSIISIIVFRGKTLKLNR